MRPFVALGPTSGTILALKAGYRPLGAVYGVSMFSDDRYNAGPLLDGKELPLASGAAEKALAGAIRQATDAAVALGATGVVGVRLDLPTPRQDASGGVSVTVRLSGTAVLTDAGPSETPFLTNLDGAGLLTLRASGYEPLGLAAAFSFYSQVAGFRTDAARVQKNTGPGGTSLLQPFEHPDDTRATYAARDLMLGRLRAAAQAFGATDVVAVELRNEVRARQSGASVDLVAVGTAVRRRTGTYAVPAKPAIVVSVGDTKES